MERAGVDEATIRAVLDDPAVYWERSMERDHASSRSASGKQYVRFRRRSWHRRCALTAGCQIGCSQ